MFKNNKEFEEALAKCIPGMEEELAKAKFEAKIIERKVKSNG